MTSKAKRKRPPSEDIPDFQPLNKRLDNLYSTVHPPTPYLIRIPNAERFSLGDFHRSIWTKGIPFTYPEAELQYVSNFWDWPETSLQAIGSWDDGKGGLARPSSKSAAETPQQVAKRIKLGDYMASKKIAESGSYKSSSPADLKERQYLMKHGTPLGRQSNGVEMKVNPRKRSRDGIEFKGAASAPVMDKKPRNSPLMEDTKPTLPPPMTPLPTNLREAVAEYKKRLDVDGSKQQVSTKQPPQDANVVVLKFRKRRDDFGRLVKLNKSKLQNRASRPQTADTRLLTPDPPTRSLKQPTPRTVSPAAIRTDAKGSHRLHEHVRSWNNLAIAVKKKSQDPDLSKSRPREALVLLITSVVAFVVQGTLQSRCQGGGNESARVIWDGTQGVISRSRHAQSKTTGSEAMEALLAYLEAYVCREQAYIRKEAPESAERINQMGKSLQASSKLMNPIALQKDFPRTWAGQSTMGIADSQEDDEVLLSKPLVGDYTLCMGAGSALAAARAARLLVIEWCEQNQLKYEDPLAVLGGVKED